MARLLAPLTGDTVTVTAGGSVLVTASYFYSPSAALQCFVGTDTDGPATLSLKGVHNGVVTCSKAAGTYNNVPVRIETNGAQDDSQTITKVVAAAAYAPAAQQTAPPPPAPLPPPGVPVKFIVFGAAVANAAYVVLVAHAVPAVGARFPVDGVFLIPGAGGNWGGEVVVPNLPNFNYVARIIQFDANDNVLRKNTVVLI